MTIEAAQQRFLQVLAEAHRGGVLGDGPAGDPLLALCIGLAVARRMHAEELDRQLAPVFAALEDLVLAVRTELRPCP